MHTLTAHLDIIAQSDAHCSARSWTALLDSGSLDSGSIWSTTFACALRNIANSISLTMLIQTRHIPAPPLSNNKQRPTPPRAPASAILSDARLISSDAVAVLRLCSPTRQLQVPPILSLSIHLHHPIHPFHAVTGQCGSNSKRQKSTNNPSRFMGETLYIDLAPPHKRYTLNDIDEKLLEIYRKQQRREDLERLVGRFVSRRAQASTGAGADSSS